MEYTTKIQDCQGRNKKKRNSSSGNHLHTQSGEAPQAGVRTEFPTPAPAEAYFHARWIEKR